MRLEFIHRYVDEIPWSWIVISRRKDVWTTRYSWFRELYGDSLLFGW